MSPRRVGVLVAHELRLTRRSVDAVFVLIAFPLITIGFLKPAIRPALVQSGFPHANGAEHVVPGQTVMSAFFLVSLITFSFYTEHSWATWDRLRASPATSLEIVLGKTLPRFGIGVLQFVVLLGAGVLVFGLGIRGNAAALVPLVFAFVICLVALGVAVTALCRTAQQANAIGYGGMVLFGALGGAFVPISVLPQWARTVAPVTPTYWAMRGMRSVILGGRGFDAVVAPSVVLIVMAVVCAVVALRRMRFDERKAGWA